MNTNAPAIVRPWPAPTLAAGLACSWRQGDIAAIEAEAMDALVGRGWKPDYMAVRRRVDLQAPTEDDKSVGPGMAGN